MLHVDVTEKIISCFFKIYNVLGYGFLEKVYQNALAYELQKDGMTVKVQENIRVYYDGQEVGDYFADLLIDTKVIVELKAAQSLRQEHLAQLTNYCKATGIQVGLLLNFGRSPEVKR